MNVIEIPPDEIIFSPSEIMIQKEADEILIRYDEFLPLEGGAVVPSKTPPLRTILLEGGTRFICMVKLNAAPLIFDLTFSLAMAALSQTNITGLETKKRTRARRTRNCVAHCRSILMTAREYLDYMEFRALQTNDNERRVLRKFKGRDRT